LNIGNLYQLIRIGSETCGDDAMGNASPIELGAGLLDEFATVGDYENTVALPVCASRDFTKNDCLTRASRQLQQRRSVAGCVA
jgi:hypothetical protein